MNAKRLLVVAILVIAVIALLFAVFFQIPKDAMLTASSSALPAIKIGVIAPLTGPVANIGEYMRNGLELAKDEINSSGGINSRKIELVFEDTVADPKLSVSAIKKFIEVDNIKAVIGDYRSPNTLAVAPIAEQSKIVLISPGTQSDSVSLAGDFVFRTQVSVDAEAQTLAEFTEHVLGAKRVFLIVLNHDYGISFEQDFRKYYTGAIGDVQKVASEETDFRTFLLKAKIDGAPVIVLAIGGKQGGLLANQAKELGVERKFVATSLIQTDELLKLGGNNVEDWAYSYPYSANGSTAEQNFSKKYLEKYGKENDVIAANSYDTLLLLALAMKNCGENTQCIKEWLYAVKGFDGASGTISFDENGDVEKPILIKTVKNGKFVQLD